VYKAFQEDNIWEHIWNWRATRTWIYALNCQKHDAAHDAAGFDASTCTVVYHESADSTGWEASEIRIIINPACEKIPRKIQLAGSHVEIRESGAFLITRSNCTFFACLQNRHSCLSTGAFSSQCSIAQQCQAMPK
jgi:hypothetical protein